MSRRESLRRNLPEVVLLRLQPDDLHRTFIWRNSPEIYKWCRQADVLHFDNHKRWFESQASDPGVSMYAVYDNGGKHLGVCGLTSIDLINRRAEFSLYIAPGHHGSGFGEAALSALVKKGFEQYGLNSIWGESFEGNPAVKMFYRVGFKDEGVRRQFYYRDGKFIDAYLFSILRSEYVG